MPLRNISRWLFLFLVLHMACEQPVCLAEEKGAPDFFEMAMDDAYPGAYGEALDFFSKKHGAAGDALLKAVSLDLDQFRQPISRIAAAIEAGRIPGDKENEKIKMDDALTGLKALAETPEGKIFLSVYNLSPDTVSEGVALFQIWRDSAAAVGKSKIAPMLYDMLGIIEQDPVIMNPNRQTGQGDAAGSIPEIQNYLWEKVIANPQWRNLFMAYLTEALQKEVPQPADWQQWALARDIPTDKKNHQKKEEYQKSLAGLLVHLTRLAEAEKQRVLARRAVAELNRKFAGPSHFQTALKKYAQAVQLLPEVNDFASKCPDLIREGKENNRMGPLEEVMRTGTEVAEQVLWHIPARGRYASERKRLLEQFRRYYYQAKDAYSLLSAAYKQKMHLEAERTDPPEWTARRYPFAITFEQVQGQIKQEYLDTGAADNTKEIIKQAYSKSLQQYETDYDAVKKVALDAMRTANDSSSREAFISFSSQWAYYKSADVQALAELELLIDEYLKTLGMMPLKNLESAMQGAEGMAGVEQIRQKMQFIEDAGFFVIESEIEKYCLAEDKLPDTGYVALPELKLTPNPDDVVMKSPADANVLISVEPARFFDSYVTQVVKIRSSVSGALMAENPCPSVGGTVSLSELISNSGRILDMMETFWDHKSTMDEINSDVAILTEFIHRFPIPKNRMPELEARINGIRQFMEKCRKLESKIRTLKPICVTRRDRYFADSHHIENDLFFLDELQKMFQAQPEAFHAFRAGYTYRAAPAGAWAEDGSYFIFKSGMAAPWSCDRAQSAPVLMTKKEIAQHIADFHKKQDASGIYALDSVYGLNIRKYTNNYIEKSLAVGRPYTPESYLYVNIGKECVFFPKEYFDALAKKLGDIPMDAPDRFNENLQRVFSKTKYYPPEKLFRVPYESHSGRPLPSAEKIDVKIFSDLDDESEKNWDVRAKASMKKATAVFREKQKRYADWKSKEGHFLAVLKALQAIDQRFSEAESKAVAGRQTGAGAEVLELLKSAAAFETEILGFASKVDMDRGLSEHRRTELARNVSALKQRIEAIKEIIRNLENTKPAAPAPASQVQDASG